MMDIIATITPTEYQIIKAQLETENLWSTGGNYRKECEANRRTEQILAQIRK